MPKCQDKMQRMMMVLKFSKINFPVLGISMGVYYTGGMSYFATA